MNWNWSFHLARLWRVDVRIHWTLPMVILFFALQGAQLGMSPAFIAIGIVAPWSLLFGSVLLHEYGHVWAARRRHLHVGHIVLTPIGGAVMVGQARSPSDEFFVAVCGPLVNVGLAAAGLALYVALGGPVTRGLLPFLHDETWVELWIARDWVLYVLHQFVGMQVFLFLFNVLLVAYPMDGGRMLFSVLWRRRGYRDGLLQSARVARFLAVPIGVVGILLLDFVLVLIAILIFVQARQILGQADRIADPGAGVDPGYERAWREQQRGRAGSPAGEGLFARFRRRRRERRIDAILRKVRERGLPGLSQREREFLRQARKES